MDIIFSLPLPYVICNKIFIYACKSPHDDLGIGVLNHFTNTDDFSKFPDKDNSLSIFYSSHYAFLNQIKPLDIFKLGNFTNLTDISITDFSPDLSITDSLSFRHQSPVIGDIEIFRFMPHLTSIYITYSNIYGDISALKNLSNLNTLCLLSTNITGNINHLSTLKFLNFIVIKDTNVSGNICDICLLPFLHRASFVRTNVILKDKNELNHIRSSNHFPYCFFILLI